MVRALLDGRALYDSSRYRGIGTYVRELLLALSTSEGVDVSVLATAQTELPAGVHRVPVSRVLANRRFGDAEHRLRLPLDIRRVDGAQVFHSTGQEPPSRSALPWVQTVHSMIPLLFDHAALAPERARWARIGPRLRHASRLIAVSSDTADAAAKLLDIPRSRFTVAHLGVDRAFSPGAEPYDDHGRPYLLCVGEYGPWKGFAEAFAVVDDLAGRGRPHQLRMVGRVTPWTEPQVRALIAATQHPERIDLVGYQSPAQLVAQYRGATALLVTSRCEGFGLPVVEAMACATPVVGFANSSLREVIGKGGIQVPDGDVGAMVAAVESLIASAAERDRVAAMGRAWSARFSWEACARVHAQVYAEVAA